LHEVRFVTDRIESVGRAVRQLFFAHVFVEERRDRPAVELKVIASQAARILHSESDHRIISLAEIVDIGTPAREARLAEVIRRALSPIDEVLVVRAHRGVVDELLFHMFEHDTLSRQSEVCFAVFREGRWRKGVVLVVVDVIQSPPVSVVQDAQSANLDLPRLGSELVAHPVVVKQLVDAFAVDIIVIPHLH
jgi:hypothetical protein